MRQSILKELSRSIKDYESLARLAGVDKHVLTAIMQGLYSSHKRTKNQAAKLVEMVSEDCPKLVYRHLTTIYSLLDRNDTVLKWNAILILGNLSLVFSEKELEEYYERLRPCLSDPQMITTSNTIKSLGFAGLHRREIRTSLVNDLVKLEKGEWDTDECRNIILGQAIRALSYFYDELHVKDKRKIIAFANRHKDNPRNATKKKMDGFLKRFG